MGAFLSDLWQGLRTSVRDPWLTLVAVATLAVGMASATVVFTWIDQMVLRPIPGVSRGEELVAFETVAADGGPLATSYRDFRDYRDRLHSLAGLAVTGAGQWNIGSNEQPERAWGQTVSGNYFAVLGVHPVLGRVFSQEESGDKPGAYPVAVIGYNLWKRRFHGDRQVIGTTLHVNRQPLTIIGVAPPDFHGSMPGLTLELWIPLVMRDRISGVGDNTLEDRNARTLLGVARLGPGTTIEQARAECATVANQLAQAEPRTNFRIGAGLLPIRKSHFGAQIVLQGPLSIMFAACGVVFLVVCANVANLLLARSTGRRREFGLRMALGAGRWRLARHLLAESLVLAVAGSLCGVLLSMWMSRSLEHLMPRGDNFPVSLEIPWNLRMAAFVVLLCASACLVSGIAPAVQGTRARLLEALKEGGRSGQEGTHSSRLRGALVACEVALALVAAIGAALFVRSFGAASRIDPGFDPHNVLVAQADLSSTGYGAVERHRFCERLRDRLVSQPGIAAASWAEVIPLYFATNWSESIEVEGYVPASDESMKIFHDAIAPGYFDLMRIPLVEGRDFDGHDTEPSPRVAIVNQTFAGRFYSGREALGRRVRAAGEWYTIVGVARDSRYMSPTESARPYIYFPLRQSSGRALLTVYLRTSGPPESALPMLRREVAALDPAVRVYDCMPLREAIGVSLFGQRTAAMLLALLGVVAVGLAAIGLYGVMAYSVAQRTQEIGIRMALGARSSDVLALVVQRGLRLTLAGVAIGVAAAAGLMRLASSLLVGVSATEPAIFAGASVFLAVVALVASYLPARRAMRIDPNDALRCQ